MRTPPRQDGGFRVPRLDQAAWGLLAAILLVLALWPMVAVVDEWMRDATRTVTERTVADFAISTPVELLVRSLAWAMVAAAAGTVLAWPASRAFRRERAAGIARGLSAVVLLPLVLPPWLLYAAVWMSTGPGTLIGDFAAAHDLVGVQRTVFLALALVVWSAALAFAVLAGAGGATEFREAHLRHLDGGGILARARAAIARDARCLLLSVVAATAFLLCETTVFDLAQQKTYGFELRTLDALGATQAEVMSGALPAMGVVVLLVALVPWLARAAGGERIRSRAAAAETGAAGRRAVRIPSGLARMRAIAPMVVAAAPACVLLAALVVVALGVPRAGDFAALHGRAVVSSALIAALAAACVAALAVALRLVLDRGGVEPPLARFVRRGLVLGAALLLVAGLVPGTVTALAAEAAFNRAGLDAIYDSPLILVAVLAMRTAPVGVLVAFALALREPVASARLRALDGGSWLARWRGMRVELGVACIAAAGVALAWSLGELTASSRVVPPGLPWLATDVLNAIHYQRPETVVLAVGAIVLVALPVAWLLSALVARFDTRARRGVFDLAPALLMLSPMLMLLPACERAPVSGQAGAGVDVGVEVGGEVGGGAADDGVMALLREASPVVDTPLRVDQAFAGVGRGRGQFNAPRVLARDPLDGSCYVIDKDARVQRIDPSGEVRAEWRMPKSDRGKPVGATVAPDGALVVADTHEHRLVAFSPEGRELWTLGSYGTETGQFIYPTDVVYLPDGRLLVAEYGGHDRIQAFSSDRRFMYAFGRGGTGDGEFLRPQAIVYDAARDELYVADAGNHRIQVFTSDGEFRRSLGAPGAGIGQFRYPFGLVLLVDGRAVEPLRDGVAASVAPEEGRRTLVVIEHSNHRLQEVDAQSGKSLGLAGGLGRELGRLKYPWAIASAGLGRDGAQRFAVCEQGNSRIAFFTLPDWSQETSASDGAPRATGDGEPQDQ